jgi:CRISPR-associated protein Csx10
MKRWLEIELLSDTCFSAPASLDNTVDTNVAEDSLGLPMLPGKTIRGLLLDTWLAAQLATRNELGLPENGERLLGISQSHLLIGRLRIGDALMTGGVREWMQRRMWEVREAQSSLPKLAIREAFTRKRVLTSIDGAGGAPKSESLRTIRVLPRGMKLRAPLDARGEIDWDLLETLVALTRHAGLHRNRGLGHIRMAIVLDEAQPGTDSQGQSQESIPDTAGTETTFLHYKMMLEAPCLVPDRQVEPNSARTLRYIPGSALRGAVVTALANNGAGEELVREVAASGKIRFLNAYPATEEGRSLPVPVTWRRKKDPLLEDHETDGYTWDLLDEIRDEKPVGTEQREPFKGYFTGSRSLYRPVKPAIVSNTHQSRDRETGITVKEETQVFVYEALAPSQAFQGCIALKGVDAGVKASIEEALRSGILIGRSALSQYGGSPTVEIISNLDSSSEHLAITGTVRAGTELVVRLTSHAVLRDPTTGQHDPWRLEAELKEALGEDAEVLAVSVNAAGAHGHNRLWRARLPELPAAAAGSVALIRTKKNMDEDDIRRLQKAPIGERTEEGKGCFIITHHDGKPTILKRSDGSPPAAQASAPQEVIQAQQRLYRERLKIVVADEAIRAATDVEVKLPASQIQRMRTPLKSEDWKNIYKELLSGSRDKRLREEALRGYQGLMLDKKLFITQDAANNGKEAKQEAKDVSLFDVMLGAAKGDWIPGAGSSEWKSWRIIDANAAKEMWQRLAADMARYYLDTLLNALSRSAKDSSREKARSNSNG